MTSYVVPAGDNYFGAATPNYLTYDTIHANDTGDTIYSYYAGTTRVYGGNGNDTLFAASNSTNFFGYGGGGNDSINAAGISPGGMAYLEGGDGNNTLVGGGHLDYFILDGSSNRAFGSNISGASNHFDESYYSYQNSITGGSAANNYFALSGGSDNVTGGNAGDFYYISHYGYNTINAGSGADTIYDSSSHNIINLGAGNDTVYAVGANNDVIVGGAGNKTIFVGPTSQTTNVQVTGGSGNDTINAVASQGINYLVPGTGSGVNVVTGGDYSNHIYGNGTTGSLYEKGGNGQDELIGGTGNNHFTITPGGDFITGGGTSNGYLFNSTEGGNTHLNNFNTATDVIGVYTGGFSGLYGGETLTLGYNLINGTQSVANTATFLYSGGGLYFDADGTGAASASVQVAGLVNAPAALSPSNFYISATAF